MKKLYCPYWMNASRIISVGGELSPAAYPCTNRIFSLSSAQCAELCNHFGFVVSICNQMPIEFKLCEWKSNYKLYGVPEFWFLRNFCGKHSSSQVKPNNTQAMWICWVLPKLCIWKVFFYIGRQMKSSIKATQYIGIDDKCMFSVVVLVSIFAFWMNNGIMICWLFFFSKRKQYFLFVVYRFRWYLVWNVLDFPFQIYKTFAFVDKWIFKIVAPF